MIVGHVIVPIMVAVFLATGLSVWTHMAICLPLTLVMTLALLQSVKGAVSGLQWAQRMHRVDPHFRD